MDKKEVKNLGYLGYSFQIKLVKQMVEDAKFSGYIISNLIALFELLIFYT